MPRLRIDGDLSFRGITSDVAAGVASLAPFGAGNPRPVFAARRVEIVDGPRRLKERHLKMALKQDGRIFRAVAWRAAERRPHRAQSRGGRRLLAGAKPAMESRSRLTLADLKEPQSCEPSIARLQL
jgi:single-stranded-DNA-specific exonuclease